MIAQLKGSLIYKSSNEAVIECGGIGYQVSISLNTSLKLGELGTEATLLTILIPKEDALQLYGFYEAPEREIFKMLISIAGIGPKIALGILSALSTDEFQDLIITGNIFALQKLPGVGKKTAERLVLELKDKITKIETPSAITFSAKLQLIKQEAIAALITLGYSSAIAEKAIRKALEDEKETIPTAEQLIKKSLKFALK